jgi:CRP-like cAMP-binding protein
LNSSSSLETIREIEIETEILQLTDGNYFGDWGILEKKQRSASAIALEETELFVLDSKTFEITFGVKIFWNI